MLRGNLPLYVSKEEIEKNSPSRQAGIDLKKETRLRKSYCTFLNDLGEKLGVDNIMVSTAILFCHRFFLRQSHTKNDRFTIAPVCMFLAGKVDGRTRLNLKKVIIFSNEIVHKKAIEADQIQKVYEQQKKLFSNGEKLLLSTLDFDFNVDLPYIPLKIAIEKYIVEEAMKVHFTQFAITFVYDSFWTSLCLQYKPLHIAAGAFFLVAKYLRMDLLEAYGENWHQEFDITVNQLDDIHVQMLERYEKKPVPWYFSREQIENSSPSRRDGINLEEETRLRKSYCTFLNDLGEKLGVDNIMVSTAILFCHRFFLRQSHTKNDRFTIAPVCMFLAGKVDGGTRLNLKKVIIFSNEIVHKKAIEADQIQKVYEQQKKLFSNGEKLLLSTLAFDFNVDLPYIPLKIAIKKYIVEEAMKVQFTQFAITFVYDSFWTSLCLQYKPLHVAAGAFFLVAKYLRVDLLEAYGENWHQEFDITVHQLDDIHVQMFERYEKKPVPWYFSREQIENSSPSRRDGINLEEETLLRKSYCTFLYDLGAKLQVDHITMFTAILFCHRFFLRQSHAKNDRWTIATVCMLIAAKVESTPLDLEQLIVVSTELIPGNLIAAEQKQEVYELPKDIVIRGEKLVLYTLNFDLSVDLPFEPITEAMKKYLVDKASPDQFFPVVRRFAQDCFWTSLCLQYQPRHLAAATLFLSAKRLKMALESVWLQHFDITVPQLNDISHQMLDFYHEEKHIAATKGSIGETSKSGDIAHQPAPKDMASTDEIEGGSSNVEGDDRSVQDKSKAEGVEKDDNAERGAGDNREDSSVGGEG